MECIKRIRLVHTGGKVLVCIRTQTLPYTQAHSYRNKQLAILFASHVPHKRQLFNHSILYFLSFFSYSCVPLSGQRERLFRMATKHFSFQSKHALDVIGSFSPRFVRFSFSWFCSLKHINIRMKEIVENQIKIVKFQRKCIRNKKITFFFKIYENGQKLKSRAKFSF